jgi:hypothetical protein
MEAAGSEIVDCIRLRGLTSQKKQSYIITAVRASDLTEIKNVNYTNLRTSLEGGLNEAIQLVQ